MYVVMDIRGEAEHIAELLDGGGFEERDDLTAIPTSSVEDARGLLDHLEVVALITNPHAFISYVEENLEYRELLRCPTPTILLSSEGSRETNERFNLTHGRDYQAFHQKGNYSGLMVKVKK